MAVNPTTFSAGLNAGAGLFSSIAAGYASKADGYLRQAGYAVQAQEALRLSGLRADKAIEYAELQSDRRRFQMDIEQLNYKAQANSLLDNLARNNAAARARAAANGVDIGSGSAYAVQRENVRNTYQDVGMVNLSALVARVFGMEDATNILKAGYDNAFYERESAISNARTLATSGTYAAKSGGLLADAKMLEGATQFAKTVPTKGYFT
jgi:hypothetical protein